ncbi:hypothetical protein LIQ05_03965 [Blautia glucerasea]|uniref:hypothetical protein n=1 Tax=Blautia glucerasea TaxID=536633 RepID=UPI001D018771|nr:hypothetical protein [Blautia glucerasea]MCB5386164.1 hypothetical protein [Blautia glucerasea]MCB5420518.1 hypothetical protein [Blautia luti]
MSLELPVDLCFFVLDLIMEEDIASLIIDALTSWQITICRWDGKVSMRRTVIFNV